MYVCSLDAIGGQTIGDTLVVADAREVYWDAAAAGSAFWSDQPLMPRPTSIGPALAVAGAPGTRR